MKCREYPAAQADWDAEIVTVTYRLRTNALGRRDETSPCWCLRASKDPSPVARDL